MRMSVLTPGGERLSARQVKKAGSAARQRLAELELPSLDLPSIDLPSLPSLELDRLPGVDRLAHREPRAQLEAQLHRARTLGRRRRRSRLSRLWARPLVRGAVVVTVVVLVIAMVKRARDRRDSGAMQDEFPSGSTGRAPDPVGADRSDQIVDLTGGAGTGAGAGTSSRLHA